jgi:hypothetical protein
VSLWVLVIAMMVLLQLMMIQAQAIDGLVADDY